MSIQATIDQITPKLTELRRKLHRIPEIGYQEFKTAATIRAELDRLKIAHVDGVPDAPTATIAWIGDTSKPCIALRADIDALPIEERTGKDYCSTHAGAMHACGHDGHTATLVGTAEMFKAMEKDLPVCVKLLWQPAEEGGGGAERLVKAGALDGRLGPKVEAVFGLHGWPIWKIGRVGTKAGPLMAATDNFIITFVGRGCHGALPHLGRDPIAAAAEATLNLQQFVSREFAPTEPAVITVGKIHGGTAFNIIPDTATIEGTARTLSREARKQIREAMERRCRGIASAHDCELKFEWLQGYPSTVNDVKMAEYVAQIGKATFGDLYQNIERPSMGGEDFSYYLEKVPGCFFFIGVQPMDRDSYPSLHNDCFDFNDDAISIGMRMFAEIVKNYPSGR